MDIPKSLLLSELAAAAEELIPGEIQNEDSTIMRKAWGLLSSINNSVSKWVVPRTTATEQPRNSPKIHQERIEEEVRVVDVPEPVTSESITNVDVNAAILESTQSSIVRLERLVTDLDVRVHELETEKVTLEARVRHLEALLQASDLLRHPESKEEGIFQRENPLDCDAVESFTPKPPRFRKVIAPLSDESGGELSPAESNFSLHAPVFQTDIPVLSPQSIQNSDFEEYDLLQRIEQKMAETMISL
ncbi:hypothetical protein PCE1_003336 [Barthelona sp. PCE]